MADKDNQRLKVSGISDEQTMRPKMSHEFDHEMANEPLTEAERQNNKKTKKRH
ncbi:small acid-soluble spore protein O [Camelliibacillus cellulosilyticus]|uniref:Small acid-soluble spore protein O n=1 Tax=Camelliibacillus cellulosilyticus TaxID=2174486 RepID=A0ABV9GQI1_9BACL